jgi:RNA polymerase sporulation-specific sigma factor
MQNQDLILTQLARKAKENDEEAFNEILRILDPEIKKISNKYYIVGSDEQDVIQECRIGIWKSIKDFDEEGGMSFKNFSLNLCVKRHLITAMSHANTQKFKLQNEAISLSAPVSQSDDDGIQTYADYITDPNSDLTENYIAKEEFNTNLALVHDKLTKLEFSIFGQYAFNSSYKDIAHALNVKPKTVDNALMRIRKKANDAYKHYTDTHSKIGIFTSLHVGLLSNEEPNIQDFIGISTCEMF